MRVTFSCGSDSSIKKSIVPGNHKLITTADDDITSTSHSEKCQRLEGDTYPWSHQAATADGANIHNSSEEAVEIREIEEMEPASMPPGEVKSADNTLMRNVVTGV